MNIISEENRKMNPSHVWFMLIPIFNIVWQFIMVSRIAESIGEECIRLNIPGKMPSQLTALASHGIFGISLHLFQSLAPWQH